MKLKKAADVGLNLKTYDHYNKFLKDIDQYHRQLRHQQIEELIVKAGSSDDKKNIDLLKQELRKIVISKKHKHTSDKIRQNLTHLIKSCKDLYNEMKESNDTKLIENCMITQQKLERLLLDFEEIQLPIEYKEIDPIKLYLVEVKKGYKPINDAPNDKHNDRV